MAFCLLQEKHPFLCQHGPDLLTDTRVSSPQTLQHEQSIPDLQGTEKITSHGRKGQILQPFELRARDKDRAAGPRFISVPANPQAFLIQGR